MWRIDQPRLLLGKVSVALVSHAPLGKELKQQNNLSLQRGSAVAFIKAWYQNSFQESATTLIEPLVDMFASEGDPAYPFKAEPAISIMGELAK
jgi:hypothetical protein